MEFFKRKKDTESTPNMSRRSFLKGAMAVGAVATGGLSGAKLGHEAYQRRGLIKKELFGEAPTPEVVTDAVNYLKETYGFDIVFGDSAANDESFVEELSDNEKLVALRCIFSEAGKYPDDFFATNRISTIQIARNVRVRELLFKTTSVGGYAQRKKRFIMLNLYPDNMLGNKVAFHHEIHHVLDFHNDGHGANQAWEKIHEGCACLESPLHTTGEMHGYQIRNRAFFDTYAETSPIEERARMAEALMVPFVTAVFMNRVQDENPETQRILIEKFNYVKDQFFRWSGGKMNEAYWERLMDKASQLTGYDGDNNPGYHYDDLMDVGERETGDPFKVDDKEVGSGSRSAR